MSASFTDTGAPAYWKVDGSWSTDIQQAAPFESEEARDAALERAAQQEAEVCDPYTFMVTMDGDRIHVLTARERIRAHGPTVQLRRPD